MQEKETKLLLDSSRAAGEGWAICTATVSLSRSWRGERDGFWYWCSLQAFCQTPQHVPAPLGEGLIDSLIQLPFIHLSLSTICANSLKSWSCLTVKSLLPRVDLQISLFHPLLQLFHAHRRRNLQLSCSVHPPSHQITPQNCFFLHFIASNRENIGNLENTMEMARAVGTDLLTPGHRAVFSLPC